MRIPLVLWVIDLFARTHNQASETVSYPTQTQNAESAVVALSASLRLCVRRSVYAACSSRILQSRQ